MKLWVRLAAMAGAVTCLALTIVNASWLAETPRGIPLLIAQRGIAQVQERAGASTGDCTAAQIGEPYHGLIDNTVASARRAIELGAHMIAVDVARTGDGELVLFADPRLDCRTDGSGPVAGKSLAQLKALDIGHGYTADGGRSFPLRGQGVGKMPTLRELAAALPGRARVLYHLPGSDGTAGEARSGAEAELLAARLAAAGRDPVAERDAFLGPAPAIARIRQLYPGAWAWTREEAWQCTNDYRLTGWTGILPAGCKGQTMLVPLDSQWTMWGWPNRLIQRMEEHGGRIVVVESYNADAPLRGLILPEQLGDIPRSFNGFILVEDSFTVIPARVPRFDNRRPQEVEAAQAALERRRNK